MKRQDKHIDFSASTQRAEKNKDPSKNKMVRGKIQWKPVSNAKNKFFINLL